jgi:hypothetical protein
MLSLTHRKVPENSYAGAERVTALALQERTDRCLLKRWPRQFSLAGVGIWAVGRLATLCCLSLRIEAHSSPKRSPPVTSIPRSPFHRILI